MAASQLSSTEVREESSEDFPLPVKAIALAALVVAAFFFFWLWGYPVEDASMLFTYSENIAAGEGVVYNPGGEAVDGASDLLLAFVLAALRFIGLPVEMGAALVNAVSLGFIVFAVFSVWKRTGFAGRWAAPGAVVLLLSSTPVFLLGATGFGTLFFAALVTLVAFLAVTLGSQPTLGSLAVVGGAVALAGMDRIEGFILGGAVVFAHSVATKSLRTLLVPAGIALSLALVWFTWRWNYFGYPLPNPFYKKGGFNPGSVPVSIYYVSVLGAPWLLVLGLGVRTKGARRHALSYVFLVVVPWPALWILLSNEMNLGGRFQFPVVPVAAVLSSVVAAQLAAIEPKYGRMNGLRIAVVAFGLMAVIGADLRLSELSVLRALRRAGFHEQVAEAFQTATGGTATLVTTEAGMVAWKTDLEVTDLWGLNDKRIAHDGILVPSEIAKLRPDLLFSHPGKLDSLAEGVSSTSEESWERMNAYLYCFAQANGFEPIAVWNLNGDWWVVHAAGDASFTPALRQRLAEITLKAQRPDISATTLPSINDCPQR
jgi:hypothetical protein